MGHCRVPNCSGVTEYDDSAQAVLCTSCGTVTTHDIFTHEWDGELSGSSLYFGPTTLMSLRRVGAGLAGQSSKEDRDRRNTTAMHQYILGVLSKLACSGLTPRVSTLFDQARVRGEHRWGKKAVLVAGACITVVLRECKKSVTMSELAALMDVSPRALCRMFTQVCSLLNLQVPPFDPLSILPILQSHLICLTTSSASPLPKALLDMIRHIPPSPVLYLASSLATLLDHLDEFSSPGPSAYSTACALFIIALEGQVASSLPSYPILARELGARVGARRDLVTSRYRDILKVLEDWMVDVPWLSSADHPDNRLGKNRRKTSQRNVIAMGIKDVVQFRDDIRTIRNKRETDSPVSVTLEVEEKLKDTETGSDNSTPPPGRKHERSEGDGFSQTSRSIRLIRPRSSMNQMDLASISLLSPSHPFAPGGSPLTSQPSAGSCQVDGLQNLILTSSSYPIEAPLTRLQQLTVSRGGESRIKDEELFEQGEMESFLRKGDEVDKLRGLLDWNGPNLSVGTHSLALPDFGWDMVDTAAWEGIEGDKSVSCEPGEQILGEWREISPSPKVGGDNSFDVCGEW